LRVKPGYLFVLGGLAILLLTLVFYILDFPLPAEISMLLGMVLLVIGLTIRIREQKNEERGTY